MAIITDATGRQMVNAVGNIDTGGLAKDTTLQATNTALGNINTTLGNLTTSDPPTDTTQQSIATAIANLGQTLGSDKANIDGSNIVNPSAFRNAIGASKNIVVDTVTYTTTQTLNSEIDYNFTFDVSKTGYTPIGIVGITKSGSYNTRFNQNKWFISGNNASITLRCSEAGVTANGISINVTILYIAN